MSIQFQENYSRRFAVREIELQREIAEDRQKIVRRKLRQALLENWIERKMPSLG